MEMDQRITNSSPLCRRTNTHELGQENSRESLKLTATARAGSSQQCSHASQQLHRWTQLALRNTWAPGRQSCCPDFEGIDGEHEMLKFTKASMKPALYSAIITTAILAPASFVAAQVSGTTTLGVTEIEL